MSRVIHILGITIFPSNQMLVVSYLILRRVVYPRYRQSSIASFTLVYYCTSVNCCRGGVRRLLVCCLPLFWRVFRCLSGPSRRLLYATLVAYGVVIALSGRHNDLTNT